MNTNRTTIEARIRDGAGWDQSITVRARSVDSGLRTAARKLGLSGAILGRERVGSTQWAVNVNGRVMMAIIAEAAS